jgi:predicted amidophosphoribosyltransferase
VRDQVVRFLRWLLQQLGARAPEPRPICPFCGEESDLVERNFCAVCGRTWRSDPAERRRLNRVMGGG